MELEHAVIPTDTAAPMSFPLACKKFFGLKTGQGFKEFAEELRALTPADRNDFVEMFKAVGYTIHLN